jgi:glycosyltransferase involved in cell wall biosynthesis
MRVAFLTDNPTQNGTVRILKSWLTLGRQEGLQGHVVIRPGSDLGRWLKINEIPHTTNSLPLPDRRWPVPSLWSALRLAAWIRRERITIIHCNEHSFYLFGVLLRRLVGLPLVCHVRYRLKREFGEWAFGGPGRRPDALLWTSRWQRDDGEPAVRGLVPEEQQHLVPIGVGLDSFGGRMAERDAVRREWGVRGDEIVIGQACVIQPRKRIEDFVELVARLARDDRRVVGVLAGDAIPGGETYRQEILRQIEATGLGRRFIWLGRLDDVEPFYHGIDVFVSTSEYETFGNSVCEAMACMRPVVAYRGGSVQEVIDGTGLVVEDGDTEALIEAARSCVRHAELREELGRQGRQRVADCFNPELSLRKLKSIYESLAARN